MAKTPGYYDAKDIADMTGMSKQWAQKKIKAMNDELKSANQFVISGSVPETLFYEKFPYIEKNGKEKAPVTADA